MKLVDATAVYDIGWNCQLQVHLVQFPDEFNEFRLRVRELRNTAQATGSAQVWSIVSKAAKLSFALSHCPLKSDHRLMKEALLKQLIEVARETGSEEVTKTIAAAVTAVNGSFNPYGDLLAKMVDETKTVRSAVLLSDENWCGPVRSALNLGATTRQKVFYSFSDLWLDKTFERIIVIGAIRQSHPEHIFTAPRAGRIDWIIADWMRTDFSPQIDLERSNDRPWKRVSFIGTGSQANPNEDFQEPIPLADLGSFEQQFEDPGFESDEELTVVCVRADFEHGLLSYYPSDSNTIDVLREGSILEVEHRKGQNLRVGDLILEVDGGSWSFNTQTADGMLGRADLHQIRTALALWSGALRNLVDNRGLEAATEVLRTKLGKPVSQQVVAGWATDAWHPGCTIIPREFQDFKSAALLVGLSEEEISLAWKSGRVLRAIRRKAGRVIRAGMLRQLVEHQSEMRGILHRSGTFMIENSGDVGRRLFVLRVEKVSQAGPIPTSKVGRIRRA